MTEDEYTVLAAQVTGAHGVSGNLRVKLAGGSSEEAARSLPAGRVVLARRQSDNLERSLTLLSLRRQVQPKGAWIAHFKEVSDRTGAEALVGCDLLIRENERPPLPEGEYYVDQLVGLAVVGDTGRALGLLTEVLAMPSHDVYVTDTDALIPAVPEFVLAVDLEHGQMTVHDVPGLQGEA